jgi:type II secretory pathway pseudopilin PulG
MMRQAGFSILTLLMLVGTMAGALAFLVIGVGPNVQGQMDVQKTAQLLAQAQLIVHRIVKCATDYPSGDNSTAFHKAYPSDTNPGALPVTALVCPGSSQNLWSGVDGVYAPTTPAGFGDWQYTNANPAVISITSSQAGTYSTSIAAAAAKIGIAASATADTLTVKVIE